MALRLKNISSVEKLFGVTGGYGAFANNEVIKNNPQLISILSSKKARVAFKKRNLSATQVLKLQNKRTLKQVKVSSPTTYKKQEALKSKAKEFLKEQETAAISHTNIIKEKPCLTNAYQTYKWYSFEKDRYYNVYLQPTLIGNYSVTKSWGSLHGNLGNYKIVFFDTLEAAVLEIDKIAKARKYKGYREQLIDRFS